MLRASNVIIHTSNLEGASRKVASLQVESHVADNDDCAEASQVKTMILPHQRRPSVQNTSNGTGWLWSKFVDRGCVHFRRMPIR